MAGVNPPDICDGSEYYLNKSLKVCFDVKMTLNVFRFLLLALVLFTGPIKQTPAQPSEVITIIIPLAVAQSNAVCAIG